jgi:hypothetical protein
MEQLIACIHAAMAEDCDCPQHRTGDAEIDPAVLQRISAAITRDQTFASLTTVRAAIADVVDGAEFYQWMWDTNEVNANAVRGEFMDAVCARVLELQREPHGMDAGLREDALESQEFYELMQAYRHASLTNQNATVTAFEAVKLFVRSRDMMHLWKTPRRRRMRVAATALRQRESEVRAEAWQPIETAPINERILVIYPTGEGGEIHIATLADYQIRGSTQNWLSSSWAIHGIGTHVIPISWQPLPAIRRDFEAQEGEQR